MQIIGAPSYPFIAETLYVSSPFSGFIVLIERDSFEFPQGLMDLFPPKLDILMYFSEGYPAIAI